MNAYAQIPLIKVPQWLPTWAKTEWSEHLPEPQPYFFVASIPLLTLRRLAGVSRRNVSDRKRGGQGLGYQRPHQRPRSKSIARYLQYGYPLSNEPGLDAEAHPNLIHPGWLPTSILVNIIGKHETRLRAGKPLGIDKSCAIEIEQQGSSFFLNIPSAATSDDFSLPATTLQPIEIIDGQHRLFAVDELEEINDTNLEKYEVPVVFFDGLTPSWQAYLFWVINVEPKKINPSLAYDLYPELRNQSWLQSGEGIKVYQEHRSQELTEVLWRHPSSPWQDRIELHGQRIDGHVSNAAFIRSLMVSFVRRWGKENKIGGLFGSLDGGGKERVLPWKRPQQAAFLIILWQNVLEAITESKAKWVEILNRGSNSNDGRGNPHKLPLAFAGPHSLLGTDQGTRAILVVFNALCQAAYSDLELETWELDDVSDFSDDDDISEAIESFTAMRKATSFLKETASILVNSLDWRTSAAPSLSEEERMRQGIYRGSSGYSQLQLKCFEALKQSRDPRVASAAETASTLLKR